MWRDAKLPHISSEAAGSTPIQLSIQSLSQEHRPVTCEFQSTNRLEAIHITLVCEVPQSCEKIVLNRNSTHRRTVTGVSHCKYSRILSVCCACRVKFLLHFHRREYRLHGSFEIQTKFTDQCQSELAAPQYSRMAGVKQECNNHAQKA